MTIPRGPFRVFKKVKVTHTIQAHDSLLYYVRRVCR